MSQITSELSTYTLKICIVSLTSCYTIQQGSAPIGALYIYISSDHKHTISNVLSSQNQPESGVIYQVQCLLGQFPTWKFDNIYSQ